jgi:hypothetical protein
MRAACAIRPYLAELVGPAALRFDAEIAEILNARGKDIIASLLELLNGDEATAGFLEEVLMDAPHYRPPQVQPDSLRAYTDLPGDVGAVLHSGEYVCPYGDYVWYRPAVGVPIPECPTHGRLNRV